MAAMLGVNYIADLYVRTGIGEASRSLLEVIRAQNIAVSYIDLPYVGDDHYDKDFSPHYQQLAQGSRHPVNILYYNFNVLPNLSDEQLKQVTQDKHTIAYWFWELPEIPAPLRSQLARVDEIWVASEYVKSIMERASSTPVRVMPTPVSVEASPQASRAHFGIPDDRYVFFFNFSAASNLSRKNVWGLIEAFKRAFGLSDDGPLLVVKVHALDKYPMAQAALYEAMKGIDGILIDHYVTRQEMIDLIALSDAYVSLHRAEGFGLGMAEAMYLGKPVIGTGYSANVDFMTKNNSYLVDYKLRKITLEDHTLQPEFLGAYEPGQNWAEPDLDQAAHYMRYLYENPEEGKRIGEIAAEEIRDYCSPERVGKQVEQRLQSIYDNEVQAKIGLNFIGDVTGTLGVTEAARLSLESALTTDLPISYIPLFHPDMQQHPTLPVRYQQLMHGNAHPVNLMYINLPEFEHLTQVNIYRATQGKYVIAYWMWELPEVPVKWHPYFEYVDEIWTSSHYCKEAFAKITDKPIHVIAPPIKVDTSHNPRRADFGIPKDRYVFFFNFNAFSSFSRKNPFAIIEAFKQAFGKSQRKGPILVLKGANLEASTAGYADLKKAMDEIGGILINEFYSRQQMNDLLACADAYISLHRSEGFGLGMAEAMYLGKPVIGTNYSSNTDFMNEENSYLVPYQLRRITEMDNQYQKAFDGHYSPGQIWAEPNIEEAARIMKRLYENQAEGQKKGKKAAEHIRHYYSMDYIGKLIQERVKQVAYTPSIAKIDPTIHYAERFDYNFEKRVDDMEGWSSFERDAQRGFRWMTQENASVVTYLAIEGDAVCEFDVEIAMAADILESTRLRVNQVPIELTFLFQGQGAKFKGIIPQAALARDPRKTTLDFQVNRVLNPGPTDKRNLAIAVSRLQIYPKNALQPKRAERSASTTKVNGINFIGDVSGSFGVTEAARLMLNAIMKGKRPVSYIPHFHPLTRDRSLPTEYVQIQHGNIHEVNLLYYNTWEFIQIPPYQLLELTQNKYTVVYWHWELENLPSDWTEAIRSVDEIWTASHFCRAAYSKVTDAPVKVIPLPVRVDASPNPDRDQFKIGKKRFVFTYSFNFQSNYARKNPMAVVEAFKRAFGNSSAADAPMLVIKANHLNNDARRDLNNAVKSLGGILINETLSRQQMYDLLACADAYVSLHRSEGFGLGMAESMYMGKPVIGTNYSANVDFMTEENSYPVRYQLRTIVAEDHHYQPHHVHIYQPGWVWAEPDVDHAAELMVHIYNNQQEARAKGEQAMKDIRNYTSQEHIAELVSQRLDEISVDQHKPLVVNSSSISRAEAVIFDADHYFLDSTPSHQNLANMQNLFHKWDHIRQRDKGRKIFDVPVLGFFLRTLTRIRNMGRIWKAQYYLYELMIEQHRHTSAQINHIAKVLPHFAHVMHTLREVQNQLADRSIVLEERLNAELQSLHGINSQLRDELMNHTVSQIEQLKAEGIQLDAKIEQFNAELGQHLTTLGQDLINIAQHTGDVQGKIDILRRDHDEMHQYVVNNQELPAFIGADAQLPSFEKVDDFIQQVLYFDSIPDDEDRFYIAQQIAFRGTEEAIRQRQKRYFEYIRIPQAIQSLPVADIGCGRGEFLSLLRESGMPCVGVETNELEVRRLTRMDYKVHHMDANTYFSTIPDDSLAGIVAFQVVEHLQPDYLQEFLTLASHKLAHGGFILLETPNPMAPEVMGTFYLDPTHIHPIHPYLLSLMLKLKGFSKLQAFFSEPLETIIRPQSLLTRYQDYALMGIKA